MGSGEIRDGGSKDICEIVLNEYACSRKELQTLSRVCLPIWWKLTSIQTDRADGLGSSDVLFAVGGAARHREA